MTPPPMKSPVIDDFRFLSQSDPYIGAYEALSRLDRIDEMSRPNEPFAEQSVHAFDADETRRWEIIAPTESKALVALLSKPRDQVVADLDAQKEIARLANTLVKRQRGYWKRLEKQVRKFNRTHPGYTLEFIVNQNALLLQLPGGEGRAHLDFAHDVVDDLVQNGFDTLAPLLETAAQTIVRSRDQFYNIMRSLPKEDIASQGVRRAHVRIENVDEELKLQWVSATYFMKEDYPGLGLFRDWEAIYQSTEPLLTVQSGQELALYSFAVHAKDDEGESIEYDQVYEAVLTRPSINKDIVIQKIGALSEGVQVTPWGLRFEYGAHILVNKSDRLEIENVTPKIIEVRSVYANGRVSKKHYWNNGRKIDRESIEESFIKPGLLSYEQSYLAQGPDDMVIEEYFLDGWRVRLMIRMAGQTAWLYMPTSESKNWLKFDQNLQSLQKFLKAEHAKLGDLFELVPALQKTKSFHRFKALTEEQAANEPVG